MFEHPFSIVMAPFYHARALSGVNKKTGPGGAGVGSP